MHLTRNQAYLHGYRGFKSLSLRHNPRPEYQDTWLLLRGRGRFIDGNDLPLARGLLHEPHLSVAHHRPR
jgi:hypothetical protein